jgi:hypothetical protein
MSYAYYSCPKCNQIEEVKGPVNQCRRCLARIVKMSKAEFAQAIEDKRVQWCNACQAFHN